MKQLFSDKLLKIRNKIYIDIKPQVIIYHKLNEKIVYIFFFFGRKIISSKTTFGNKFIKK